MLRGLLDRLPRAPTLRDSRRQLLSALARQYREDDSAEPRTPSQPGETHVLFSDGGCRGNLGPGGAGAALVSADRDAMNRRVDWSGCMSYAQADMTNNRAEYMGVITGLREAKERGWKVDVVGDSNLILRQLADYRPPAQRQTPPALLRSKTASRSSPGGRLATSSSCF
jgi:ribonuclease HI